LVGVEQQALVGLVVAGAVVGYVQWKCQDTEIVRHDFGAARRCRVLVEVHDRARDATAAAMLDGYLGVGIDPGVGQREHDLLRSRG
jgi:hypothetical protein